MGIVSGIPTEEGGNVYHYTVGESGSIMKCVKARGSRTAHWLSDTFCSFHSTYIALWSGDRTRGFQGPPVLLRD